MRGAAGRAAKSTECLDWTPPPELKVKDLDMGLDSDPLTEEAAEMGE